MKFINTKEDMVNQIRKHNDCTDSYYKIMVDYDYRKDLYKAFEGIPGVLALPYTVSSKEVMLYFINQEYLVDIWKHQSNERSSRAGKFTSREVKVFMRRRLAYYDKLFGKEYIVNDLITFKNKGMIEEDFMTQRLNYGSELLDVMNKAGLNNIEVSSRCLSIEESTYNIEDIVTPLEEYRVAFRGIDKILASTEEEIQIHLNKEYTKLEMYSKQLIVRKEFQDTETLLREFIEVMTNLIKTCAIVNEFGIKHQAISLVGFLLKHEFPKDYILNGDILTVIAGSLAQLNITNMHSKSRKYISRTFSNNFYSSIYKNTEEICDVNTLNLYCKKYNELKPHKILVDFQFSTVKYELSKQFESVIPYIMYLEQDKRFVIIYQFNTDFDKRQFQALIKESSRDSKLDKVSIREIAQNSFLLYSSLVFDAQMIKGLYYLYKAGIIKSDEFVTDSRDIKIKNIRDLFRITKLEDIIFKDNKAYVKLKGAYRLKPLDTIVRRCSGEYFTIIKFVSSDAFVISRIVSDLSEFDCTHKGNDLNDNCKMLFTRLQNQIQPSKRKYRKWLKDIETYDHFYKICKNCSFSNEFVDLYSKVFKSRCCN